MKIGFDAKRAFFNKSGLGNYSRNLIYSLINNFPENDYFLFTTNENSNLFDINFRKNLISPQTNLKLKQNYWRSFLITNEIIKHKLDIYHGLSNELPLNINKSNVKKFVTIHDLIFLKFPHLYNPIDVKIYNYKFKKACCYADKIIATSEQTKIDVINYYHINEKKIEVIYQSYNDIFTVKSDKQTKVFIKNKYNLPDNFILNVGTIEKRKNLLSIIKSIDNNRFNINLVVVGKKTKYQEEIEKYLKNKEIKNKILFLENVSNNDLPTIYQLSKLLIYPSLYEGFGIPIIEAFASEIPVITSNTSSMFEISEKFAICVNPNDCEEITNAIEKLLNNPQHYKYFVELSKKGKEFYSTKTMLSNIINCYLSI